MLRLTPRPPTTSSLIPYTTLFRSRTDEYGGSLENRARIVVEILAAIHEEIDGKLAVGMRFTADQLLDGGWNQDRSEEHTSELQSHSELVCRLALEKNNAFHSLSVE